jgi:hypothetical protein
MRGPRNGFSREVLTFVWCARPSVWLQKSASVVRSRQVPPVAAGGGHGDSARGTKPAKNGSRRRTGGERASPGGNTLGELEGPEKGSLVAEGVRCRGNRRLSRDGSRSGIGWKVEPASPSGKSTSDTGVRGRNFMQRGLRHEQCRTRSRGHRPKRGQSREAGGLIDKPRVSR